MDFENWFAILTLAILWGVFGYRFSLIRRTGSQKHSSKTAEQSVKSYATEHSKTLLRDRLISASGIGLQLVGLLLSILPGISVLLQLQQVQPYRALIGLLVVGIGQQITLAIIADMQHMWSWRPRIASEHRLMTTGWFAWVRHPIYLSYGFVLLGQSILWSNVWLFMIAILTYGLGTCLRIQQEEALLAKVFGSEWQAYRSRTAAIVPLGKRPS